MVTVQEALQKAVIENGDISAALTILSGIKEHGAGTSTVPIQIYRTIIYDSNPIYKDKIRELIADTLFNIDEEDQSVILDYLIVLDNHSELIALDIKDFKYVLSEIDSSITSIRVRRSLQHFTEDDVKFLDNLLEYAGDGLKYFILSNYDDKSMDEAIRIRLISYIVEHSLHFDYFTRPRYTLRQIDELSKNLSEEALFALLFASRYIKSNYYCRGKCTIDFYGKNPKEKMLWMRYLFEKPDYDTGMELLWLTDDSCTHHNGRDEMVRAMATKTFAERYNVTCYEGIFNAFLSFDPSSEFCKKYEIYESGSEDRKSLFDTYFNDELSYDGCYGLGEAVLITINENWQNKCSSLAENEKKFMTEVFQKIDEFKQNPNIVFETSIISEALGKAIKERFPKDFIRALAGDYFYISEIEIPIDKEYYIKCLGSNAVAVVKFDMEGWKKYHSDPPTIIGDGIKDLFFINPITADDEYVNFKVVGFKNDVYGTNRFCIKERDNIVELEIGSDVEPWLIDFDRYKDRGGIITFYNTYELALQAPFEY